MAQQRDEKGNFLSIHDPRYIHTDYSRKMLAKKDAKRTRRNSGAYSGADIEAAFYAGLESSRGKYKPAADKWSDYKNEVGIT